MIASVSYFPAVLLLLFAQTPATEPADTAAIQDSSFVNTSFEAEEALRKAREQVARPNWAIAANAMQQIIEKFGDHVIRLERGRYIGISRFVHAEIATWPTDGLDAYRLAYEKAARTAFEEAEARRDIRGLLDVAETYFCTAAGAAALNRAGELAIEAGDFRSARNRFEELIAHHPDRHVHGIDWRAKSVMAEAWSGNAAPLRDLLLELKKNAAHDRRMQWAGRDQPISALLKELLDEIDPSSPSLPSSNEGEAPAAFCGGAERHGAFQSSVSAEAMLWRCQLYDNSESNADLFFNSGDATETNMALRAVESGRLLTLSPVFGNSRVFISNGRNVWAIDPSRPEKPEWRFDLAGPPQQPLGWISEDEPPDQHTLLFHDASVIAPLQREATHSDDDASRRVSVLACLDGATGKLIWKNELAGLATRFEELSLDGAPIAHNNLLYTVIRKRKGFGFEACLLLCFEPVNGKIVWSTHVGEAATGSYGFTHPTRSLPAADGDRIFIHTNLGTIAAVNAFTGHVEWLVTYPSRYANESEAAWPTRFGQPLRPWQYQPTMIWRSAIVCAPMDLDQLLILDQTDGRIIRRTDMDRLFNPDSILGIKSDRLYAAGAQLVCHNLDTGELAWQRPLAETSKPFGRGAIVSEGLLVPTATALLRYPLDGGPATVHRWRIENAGNLLPLGDQIVVAGSGSIAGLIARDEAFARMTARFQNDTTNADAALAIAELAFETGDDARGINAVKDAVRAETVQSTVNIPRRRGLFLKVLRITEELMSNASARAPKSEKEPTALARTKTLIEIINLTGKIAPDAECKAVHRLIAGRLHLQNDDPPQAIAAYQHLLENSELRALRLPVPRDWMPRFTESEPLGIEQESSLYLLAEEWIDSIIELHGRASYSKVEATAVERLEAARQSQNASDVAGVAREFPNSIAAGEAHLLFARRAIRDGHPNSAISSLRLCLSRAGWRDRDEAVRLMSETLTAQNCSTDAARWLARGLRDYPDLRFEDEAGQIGFGELLTSLTTRLPENAGRAESPHGSLVPAYRCVFAQRVAMLSPMESATDQKPLDLLLTYADSKIEARNASTGRPLWEQAAICPTLPILLGSDGERIRFAGAHSLFALKRATGQKVWQFGANDDEDPMTDPEELETWTDHVAIAGRIISSSDRGDVVCINASTGTLQWRREIEGGTASHLAADGQFVYCAKWRGRNNVIHFLDAATGQPRGELSCEDSRPIQLLYPSPDNGLLVIMAKSIMRIDPASLKIEWSIATPRHFLVSTFLHDEGGFILSDDARRIIKRDDVTGRLLWRSVSIGKDDRDGLWTASTDGRIIAASREELFAFDGADGRLLWRNHDSVSMRWQSPIVTGDSIVMITPRERAASQPANDASDRSTSYRITRHALADGKQLPVGRGGPLITEPMESFGGLYVRDKSIIVLDGPRLIGYVAE